MSWVAKKTRSFLAGPKRHFHRMKEDRMTKRSLAGTMTKF
jgi:hypothetical protein